MDIYHSVAQIPDTLSPCAFTFGVFDGVHTGHSVLLETLSQEAYERGLPTLAMTFDPHPAQFHRPEDSLKLINTVTDRILLLGFADLDAVIVQEYDSGFAKNSAQDFVLHYLVESLEVKLVVIGQDARFGAGNEGDADLMVRLGREYGFEVIVLPDVTDENGRRWSSSWVRELLAQGQVQQAARVLGHPHRVRGVVVHGAKRGRQLGFPTANVQTHQELPADGVYAGWLVVPHPHGAVQPTSIERLPAAISVGMNPQFDGTSHTVEAHVLGRSDLNLYGDEVMVDFVERLRPMMKCDSVDQLLARMDIDLKETARVLGVPPAGRVNPGSVTAC